MKKNGFTLLEIVVVIALLIIFGIAIIPFSASEISRQRVDATTNEIISNMYTQKQKSYASLNGNYHGIQINSDSINLLEGPAENDLSIIDEIFFEADVALINSTINPLNNNRIVFIRGSEQTNNFGLLEIGNGTFNKIITINEQGIIDTYVP
jgi:type II secretory pathway pseudopilin PulG